MEFIHHETMVPMNWSHYTEYHILSVEEYIKQIAPWAAEEIHKEIRTRILFEFDTDYWYPFVKSSVIFPADYAEKKTYNVWADAAKPNIFDDFSNLFKDGGAPDNDNILAWLREYGVPYVDVPANFLEPAWRARNKSAIALRRGLKLTGIIRTVMNEVILESQETSTLSDDFLQRTHHFILKDVFIELARDAYSAQSWYFSLRQGEMPRLEWDEETALFPLNKPLPKHITPETIPIEMWKALRDKVLCRIQGVKTSLNVKRDSEKFPFFEISQAYIADDLFSVMWARFYHRLLLFTPMRRCECGKFFPVTKSNKTYCNEDCQVRYAVRRCRAKKKELSSNMKTVID